MPVSKPGGKAWEKNQPKYDTNGKELFNVDALPCWISGIGSGLPTVKNTSGVPVAKILT